MAVVQSTVAIVLVGHSVHQQHREAIGEQFGLDRLSAHGSQAGGEKREAETETGRNKQVLSMVSYSSRSRLAVWAQALAMDIRPQYDADRIVAIKRRWSRRVDGVAAVAGVGRSGSECGLAVAGTTTRATGNAMELEMAADGKSLAVGRAGGLAIWCWNRVR